MGSSEKTKLSKRSLVAIGCAVVGIGSAAGIAAAGVLSQTLVVDRADAQIRVVHTEVDDFDSGWHTHPGIAVVQVKEGALRIYQRGCEPTIVGAGETYVETPGIPVKGVAKGHAEWTTTLIVPKDAAFATAAADPCG